MEYIDHTQLIWLILVATACGILVILTWGICCYWCARRYYIKKEYDEYNWTFGPGPVANFGPNVGGGVRPNLLARPGPPVGPIVTPTSVTRVGCAPGGACGRGLQTRCGGCQPKCGYSGACGYEDVPCKKPSKGGGFAGFFGLFGSSGYSNPSYHGDMDKNFQTRFSY